MKHETMNGGVLEMPTPPPEVLAFLERAWRDAQDEVVTVGEFIALVWGVENPILDRTTQPGRALVTAEVFALPFYGVMADLLGRKQEQQDALRFSLTVAESAVQAGVTDGAIRQAIAAHRLPARKVRGAYRINPDDLVAYHPSTRGPKRALRARVGNAAGVSFRVKGARVEAENIGGAREGLIPNGWTRIAVLAAKGEEGARFWELAPAEGETASLDFEGFYVRGGFQVVAQVNNEREARDRYSAFR